MPIACPSSTICFIKARPAEEVLPVTKNVAFIPFSRRISNISDVRSDGPSSKVRKIVFSGIICDSGRVQYKCGYNFV